MESEYMPIRGKSEVANTCYHNGHLPSDSSPDEEHSQTETRSNDVTRSNCGYRRCQPQCLQRFNTPPWLLVATCCFSFMEGFIIFGVINVNTTSLERRFSLSSWRVAWVTSSEDMAAGALTILLGYWGTFATHKGRIVSVGCLIFGFGSLVMALPHFLTGTYHLGAVVTSTCQVQNGTSDGCVSSSSSGESLMLFVFIAGQLLHAVGAASLYTLAVPWLDDNIKAQNTPLYIGILHATAGVGSAVGYVAGGLCLENLYVDLGRIDPNEISITSSDPRWVGAWWICFIVSSAACVLSAIFLGCFPPLLPAGIKNNTSRKSQAYKGQGDRETAKKNFGRSGRDFLYSLKILLSNPTFMCLTLGGTIDAMGIVAFSTFLPKIIQFLLTLSSGSAALITGMIVVPAAILGQIIGGIIPKVLKLQVRGLLLLGIISSALSGCFTAVFLIRCDMPDLAGVTVPYHNVSEDSGLWSLSDACNAGCDCTTYSYEPVCGENGVTYFSPCHAGCQHELLESGEKIYSNCSCIRPLNDTGNDYLPSRAGHGVCDMDCGVRVTFFILSFVTVFLNFISINTGWAITIRCVPEKERTFALGVQQTIGRFLGNVPGPLIFGTLFDTSCLVWQDSCEERGSCWVYNNQGLAISLLAAALSVKVFSTLFQSLALLFYRPPNTSEESITIAVNSSSPTDSDIKEDQTLCESSSEGSHIECNHNGIKS